MRKLGDLRDPKYLDFISFAQHDTISTCMKNAPYVFDEAVRKEEADLSW
jgi:hypothetical protein